MFSQESAKMVYECVALRITARTNDDLCFFGTPESKSAKTKTHFPNLYGSAQNDTNVYNSYGFDPLAKAFYMVMVKTELFMSNYSVFLETSTETSTESVVLLCISLDPHEVSIQKNTLAVANLQQFSCFTRNFCDHHFVMIS